MSASSFHYKLTSTIILYLAMPAHQTTGLRLGGHVTRQSEHSVHLANTTAAAAATGHVENMGRIVETAEAGLRANLHDIYLSKTADIAAALRVDSRAAGQAKAVQAEILKGMGK